MNFLTFTCLQCSRPFEVRASRAKQWTPKFCGWSCRREWERAHPKPVTGIKADPELHRAYKRALREKHRDHVNARRRELDARRREEINRLNKEWREKNNDRWTGRKRERYATDPEFRAKQSEFKKAAYRKKPEQYQAKNRENRLAKIEEYLQRNRAYYEANRHLWIEAGHLRRARQRNAAIGADREAYKLYMRWAQTADIIPCHWCGTDTLTTFRETGKRPVVRRHVDHLVPLARGGKHCVSNLCISCPTCNNRKFTKTPDEFRRSAMSL